MTNDELVALVTYLKEMIADMAHPLAVVLSSIDGVTTDTGAKDKIIDSLLGVGYFFLNVDGNIDNSEISYASRVVRDVCADGNDFRGITNTELAQIIRDRATQKTSMDKLSTRPIIESLAKFDEAYGTNHANHSKAMFFRFANAVCKSDGKISSEEEHALREFKEFLWNDAVIVRSNRQKKPVAIASGSAPEYVEVKQGNEIEALLKELDSLIGLEPVKNDVRNLVNFLKVQALRRSKGLPSPPISSHLVFSGNPGTGKTTIARLLAQIYAALGVSDKGHLIETDRASLVSGYLGQTAIKVKNIADSAMGGILFIDEAYTLSSKTGDQYGQEAIDTLLKIMEDKREDLVVVVAGYTEKMKDFIASNPGLRSRFNKYLHFVDYTPSQLVEIFDVFCSKASYKMCDETRKLLHARFSELYEKRDASFGNARVARNMFELTISKQANRVVCLTDITVESLCSIVAVDIPEN